MESSVCSTPADHLDELRKTCDTYHLLFYACTIKLNISIISWIAICVITFCIGPKITWQLTWQLFVSAEWGTETRVFDFGKSNG